MRVLDQWPILVGFAMLANPWQLWAQDDDEEESPKTIAELTADSDRFDGLFTLFRNRGSGETHLLIEPDQLGREYIYFAVDANPRRKRGGNAETQAHTQNLLYLIERLLESGA